jgi:enoyl-CoA hydratase/carnithine racemase
MNTGSGKSHELLRTGVRFTSSWTKDPLTCVKFETALDGRVAVITLSRPANRNAWTEIMRNEIARCVDEASRNPKIRATIITGDPEGRAFCAGADLGPAGVKNPSSMQGDVPQGRNANLGYWRDGGGIAGLSIMRSTKPVLCAINGAAVGIGMTLPLACDMTVASHGAKVGFVFGKRGLTMECLSSYMLERCVGHKVSDVLDTRNDVTSKAHMLSNRKVAMELVLTGRIFKAEEAPAGLFNYVVEPENVMRKTLALCEEICETSPMSAMLNRNMIIRNGNCSPEEAHLIESKSIYWVSRHADAKEGISSFLEKRPPQYPMDPFSDSPDWFPWWREVNTTARL